MPDYTTIRHSLKNAGTWAGNIAGKVFLLEEDCIGGVDITVDGVWLDTVYSFSDVLEAIADFTE